MLVATVVASLMGVGTTTAIFVKAWVVHSTCQLPLLLLSRPNMHPDVGSLYYQKRGKRCWLGDAFSSLLAVRLSWYVPRDVVFGQRPPPGSLDLIHGGLDGAVARH